MNKKFIAMLFLMAPLALFAQKFGHLNSADIMPLMPEFKTAQTELENLEKQYTNELQMMESELAKKSEAYEKEKATLPVNIQQRREQELQELYGRMQQYYQQSQQELAQASQEKQLAILEKINKAITNGSEAKPVSNGFNCNTLWKNRTNTKNVPDITILYNNLIDVPIRKFLSLNNSTSSNGTLPDLFLLSSNHIKIAKTINPKIISIMLVATSLVRVKIPSTSKRRHIPESIAPIISRSFLDSVGLKSGILFCITKNTKIKKMRNFFVLFYYKFNSTNRYEQQKSIEVFDFMFCADFVIGRSGTGL